MCVVQCKVCKTTVIESIWLVQLGMSYDYTKYFNCTLLLITLIRINILISTFYNRNNLPVYYQICQLFTMTTTTRMLIT